MKKTLIVLAFIAAHSVATATPAHELRACAYEEIKAAVVLGEVLPAPEALILIVGCGDDKALGYMKRMEQEGVIVRTPAGWRVK